MSVVGEVGTQFINQSLGEDAPPDIAARNYTRTLENRLAAMEANLKTYQTEQTEA